MMQGIRKRTAKANRLRFDPALAIPCLRPKQPEFVLLIDLVLVRQLTHEAHKLKFYKS